MSDGGRANGGRDVGGRGVGGRGVGGRGDGGSDVGGRGDVFTTFISKYKKFFGSNPEMIARNVGI